MEPDLSFTPHAPEDAKAEEERYQAAVAKFIEQTNAQIERMTKTVGEEAAAILAEAGTDFDHVLKATCFLDDIDDFAAFNAEYAKSFGDARPARSAVGVAKLPKGALVEVEVIAEV